jgi:hypothetical protein
MPARAADMAALESNAGDEGDPANLGLLLLWAALDGAAFDTICFSCPKEGEFVRPTAATRRLLAAKAAAVGLLLGGEAKPAFEAGALTLILDGGLLFNKSGLFRPDGRIFEFLGC